MLLSPTVFLLMSKQKRWGKNGAEEGKSKRKEISKILKQYLSCILFYFFFPNAPVL